LNIVTAATRLGVQPDDLREIVHEISGIIANRTPHVNYYDRRQLICAQQYTGIFKNASACQPPGHARLRTLAVQ